MSNEKKAERERIYGPRFEKAMAFAASCHHGQSRKGSGAPYITHPMAVSSLVGEYGGDEDQAIAGLLHDVMEDCGIASDDLVVRFGERVARIVVACTDTTEQPKPPWRQRKEQHVSHVREQPAEVKLVLGCDKLHNASCIVRDLQRESVGALVWDRFRAERPDVLWYYRAMHAALAHQWHNEVLSELERMIDVMQR
jgi:(p)ppGpp synthase/HD superfamily hydrolase